ncbi:MAG TPA: YciI family protein [Vicinamibacterales bacterium]|jgi:hypothetical protein
MRYLCIFKTAADENVPAAQEETAKMGALIQEMASKGLLVATEGCQPSAKGMRIRQENGTVTVTDGPFTEAKEILAGFAMFDVKSKSEMVELTRRFLSIAGDGEVEVRLLHEAPALAKTGS